MSDEKQTQSTTETTKEEFEISANHLVDRVQELIHQGNIRRIIIRSQGGRVLMDTSLTVGAGLGGALAIIGGFPLAALAAIAAAFARVKIEVVRELQDGDVLEDRSEKKKIDVEVEDPETENEA